jgi:hypothetical protein
MPDLKIDKSQLPQSSAIKKSGLGNFLGRLFGFQRNKNNIEFVKVDIGSNERVGQALLNNKVTNTKLSDRLESLYQYWLTDTTDKLTELSDRKSRLEQLQYMYLNDPYVNRTVALYADEATQLDEQDTIIAIETPDPRMTRDMYKLLSQWGLTQPRIRATIEQLAIYGDAFWANKVTDNGVERIIPLQQYQISDRVEFNPVKVMEIKNKKEGAFFNALSKNYLLSTMFEDMTSSEDFTDIFDAKLFGFTVGDDLVVPPWNVTHFRIGGEASDFWPWGTSPILGALSPYKQTQSTITLQSLARMMSFPITLYKVKTDENMDEARQFATVNRVREAYDNIGVNPSEGNSEVYTVNTKIWMPDGLLTVETIKPETGSSDGVDDVKLYQDREAVALGLPRSFYGEEGWFSTGNSGKSLTQQYKPFARKVYSIQSAFLEGVADLFRIHFAVTGQYDFRIPFTLSMKYPVVEQDDEYTDAQKGSLELADSVTQLIRSAIGASEDEALPPDIIRDIINKYTFLNASDILKWTRGAKYQNLANEMENPEGEEDEGEFGGFDDGGPSFSDIEEPPEPGSEPESGVEESKESRGNRLREKRLLEKYETVRDDVYFQALRECAITGFVRNGRHIQLFERASDSSDLMLKTLSKEKTRSKLNG